MNRQDLGLKPKIVGIFGLQGTGKTMLLTALGVLAHRENIPIYANYHLTIPYTPIDSLEDIDQIHDGIFLADELWLWCFSRSSMTRMNQDLIKIVMLNRKRGVTIAYTTQTIGQADKLLRNVTNTWIEPHIMPIYGIAEDKVNQIIAETYKKRHHEDNNITHEEIEKEIWELAEKKLHHPSNYRVHAEYYNAYGYHTKSMYFKNLEFWGSFYNTHEEIGSLHRSRAIPYTIQEGIEMENHFVEAIQDLPFIQATDHLPNSGHGSGKKFDVILQTDYGKLGIDVKTTNQTRVSVHPENLQKQIINATTNKLIPFIVFPKQEIIGDSEELKKPENWYVHPIENSYLLGLNQPPKYGKLAKNSLPFPNLPIFLENQITT